MEEKIKIRNAADARKHIGDTYVYFDELMGRLESGNCFGKCLVTLPGEKLNTETVGELVTAGFTVSDAKDPAGIPVYVISW